MFGLFGNSEELPKKVVAKEEISTWRDATSPTHTVTSPPPTSFAFPGFIPFLDSVNDTSNSISDEPSTPVTHPNYSPPDVDNPVVLNSAIKMLQKRLDEEKQKNKALKVQIENESANTPISLAPFSIDKSLRLRESFGQFFGMTEAGPSTNTAEDENLQSSPFAIPSIPMSLFGAVTTEPPSSTLNVDNEGNIPPAPHSFYSNMIPSIPFVNTTRSASVSAPQGPAIDVQMPSILPAQVQAQSETIPPSPPISSPFSVNHINPLSYFGTATESTPVVICPPDTVRDLGTSFDTEVLHQSPAGKASSGSPAKTPNMEPIRVAVEALLEVHNQEDRARIAELEGLLNVSNTSKEELERMLNGVREDLHTSERQVAAATKIAELEGLLNVANTSKEELERMLNGVREDLHTCERQIAAATKIDGDRLHRIAELEARTRNYQSRITELELLAGTDREQLVDLQTRLEELVTEKRKRDELTGVNPLIQKQKDVDRKEISRLSKLLDETMTALNDTHKACEVAEAEVRELQAMAQRTDSISMADSGSTSRESSTDMVNETAMIRIRELEQQLELLRSSQTSADLCLIQMDEQRKKSKDEAALLRAQLSESQSKLALMELQHQQLVDATMDKPTNIMTPSALRSKSSSSRSSIANTPPQPPPVTPTSSAYSQPPIPATPATPGPDDAKRMDRVRIINAGLLRLALDTEFQEDIKRPFVRSAMDIWGGLPGASQLSPQDHESIKEDPGVYRVYPKIIEFQAQCESAGFKSFKMPVEHIIAGSKELSSEALIASFGVDFALKVAAS